MDEQTEAELAQARARREAFDTARRALAAELRGAPHNAPANSQLTYVGGLARARRILERLYVASAAAEEHLVLDGPSEAP